MHTHCITFRPEIKGVTIKNVQLMNNTYHVYALRDDHRAYCCQKKMHIHDYRNVCIKSLNYGSRHVLLHIKKQRYICSCCKKKITSSLPSIEKHCTISNEVKNEIQRKCGEMKSLTQIGTEENVSLSTVLRILHAMTIPIQSYDYSTIYLDEFKGNAAQETYQLAIYDAKHRLISILHNRKSATVKAFLRQYSHQIQRVSIDMFMQFRNCIKSTLPHADIVADKYHVIRQANWMIRDVRVRLHKGDSKTFKPLKNDWKLIAKNPIGPLTDAQIKRLKKLKELSPIFAKAYDLRTSFFKLFEEKNEVVFLKKLDALIVELASSEIEECITLANTLYNWRREIGNIQKHNINNGFVEGKNNKIKVIKRISYGIRTFSVLEKLIQLRIS